MVSFGQLIDQSIDIKKWSFYANKPNEIPQEAITHVRYLHLPVCKMSDNQVFRDHSNQHFSLQATDDPTIACLKSCLQFHHHPFNQGNTMLLIMSKTTILAGFWTQLQFCAIQVPAQSRRNQLSLPKTRQCG